MSIYFCCKILLNIQILKIITRRIFSNNSNGGTNQNFQNNLLLLISALHIVKLLLIPFLEVNKYC